jgi:hypothetical protein
MSGTTYAQRALAALVLGLVASLAGAGAGVNSAWKSFLPSGAYQELKGRSARTIDSIKGNAEKDRKRKEVEGYLLQGYERAASKAAEKNGSALRLAVGEDLGEMMNLLRDQAKGGEGIAADLQYNGKLKKQNGIESLIGALAQKALTADNATKTAKELELLAYRVAVMGAITHDNPPADKKDAQPAWRKMSLEMRDASLALAESAEKKDSASIQMASERLQNTCTQCHRKFR